EERQANQLPGVSPGTLALASRTGGEHPAGYARGMPPSRFKGLAIINRSRVSQLDAFPHGPWSSRHRA
ncbi:MAG TPA: hypothetical protein VK570_06790, partial [Rubrivivax sp.]|nr:hypothetical protein [Rubrivivax sp.]